MNYPKGCRKRKSNAHDPSAKRKEKKVECNESKIEYSFFSILAICQSGRFVNHIIELEQLYMSFSYVRVYAHGLAYNKRWQQFPSVTFYGFTAATTWHSIFT